jgi:hypothetical protein
MKKLLMIMVAMVMFACAPALEQSYTLEKGQKIIQTTWIYDDLWILTRPMIKTDIAETLSFSPAEHGIFDFKKPIKLIETK